MDRSGEQPEVLLPPGAHEVAAHALAPPPHRQRQALRPVDALLHQLLLLAAAPAPQEAAVFVHTGASAIIYICTTHSIYY